MMELTEKEQNAINTLKKLAKRWPENLWLFADGEQVSVMKLNADGERAVVEDPHWQGQGDYVTDLEYRVCDIDIPCSSGIGL